MASHKLINAKWYSDTGNIDNCLGTYIGIFMGNAIKLQVEFHIVCKLVKSQLFYLSDVFEAKLKKQKSEIYAHEMTS